MPRCFVGLGGNQGDVGETFSLAIKTLDSHPSLSLSGVSSRYRSLSMGGDAGDSYLNAVAEFDASLSAEEFLSRLQAVEQQFGRVRRQPWGPRPLDLDLLYYGDLVQRTPELCVPHTSAWYRRFVLVPMCEIAADFPHPVFGLTQAELLARIDVRPLAIQLTGCDAIPDGTLNDLVRRFGDVRFERTIIPDPDEGLIVLGREKTPLNPNLPAIRLSELPHEPARSLQSVLEAALGTCEKVP